MRVTFLLLFPFLFFIQDFHLHGQGGFELSFGGSGSQVCNSLILADDTTAYMLGYTTTGPSGGNDFMLSKVTPQGEVLWTKFYGTLHDDEGVSIILKNNQLILSGNSHDPLLSTQLLFIVTDTAGNQVSSHSFGTLATEMMNHTRLCADGGFLIAGYQSAGGSNYAYTLKLDSLFTEKWSGTYGTGLNDYASEGVMLDSNTYFISTDRKINLGGGLFDYDVALVKADSSGLEVWDSLYTENFQNGCQGLFINQQGNLVTYGETEIAQFSLFDYFIMEMNTDGERLWRKSFGGNGSNALFDLIQDASGTYTGTGYGNSFSNGTGQLNLTIIQTDVNGTLLWQREFGGTGTDIGFSIVPFPGGGYLVAGRTDTISDVDFYLLRTDDFGFTGIPQVKGKKENISLYPNPAGSYVYVPGWIAWQKIHFYDSGGKLAKTINYNNESGRVDLSELSQGFYWVEIASKSGIIYRCTLGVM